MEAKIRKLGTLYSGSEMIGSENSLAYSKDDHPRDLIIRDTVPGLEITWVEYDGLLMARYPVLCKISFDDLKFAGSSKASRSRSMASAMSFGCCAADSETIQAPTTCGCGRCGMSRRVSGGMPISAAGIPLPAPGSYSFDGVLTALTDSDSRIWTAVLPPIRALRRSAGGRCWSQSSRTQSRSHLAQRSSSVSRAENSSPAPERGERL